MENMFPEFVDEFSDFCYWNILFIMLSLRCEQPYFT